MWFPSSSMSESASIFFILTTCFFGGMMATFDINEFTIAPENSRKIGRAPCGLRLISYNAVRCPAGHRPMSHIRRRPAPVRYVTTQEKILKNRQVPRRLSNSPVMCKSVKSYDVSFICDHSINNTHFFSVVYSKGEKQIRSVIAIT